MKGIIRSKILTEAECFKVYGLLKGKLAVSVDKEKCNGCGICKETCFFYAIEMAEGTPVIDQERCEGCRLCICNCPTGALSLGGIGISSIREVARQWRKES